MRLQKLAKLEPFVHGRYFGLGLTDSKWIDQDETKMRLDLENDEKM